MKHRLLDYPTLAEVLDDDPLEESRRHSPVPDPLGIDSDDRSAPAHTETRGLAPFDTCGAKEEILALQERGEARIEGAASSLR